ncbi:hypothetical protein ALC62_13117 [Cyphomyrmex costatus]|uniref:BTB domain-containing protein n=1 Tax=Cyphomyrmex costatus TaxID=456900 RepID=A0A151IAV4_9HYME|nr:hypothetical protein ALC62_13117 [Cyphomyrmex costatus]
MRITETFAKNKEKVKTKYAFCHCRTKCNVRVTTYVWSITDFWDTCNFTNTLISSNIEEQPFQIKMCTDRKHQKLHFFIQSTKLNSNDRINIHKYNVSIQCAKETALQTGWKIFHLNSDPLYEVCLKTLQLNETKYLCNNTLSVHFMFQSYENVSHSIIHETISETSLLTATKDSASYKSNSFVTFLVDGKHLRINKSLICAASSVINSLTCNSKENDEEEIEISNIPYDIFKLVAYYIETRDLFESNLNVTRDVDNNTHYINILFNLISIADKLDIIDLKVMCEKRVIKYITKENAVAYLDLAINSNAVYLANYIKRLIKLHLDEIIITTEFLERIKTNPKIFSDILNQELFKEDALLCATLISLSYAVITVVNRTLSSVSVGFVVARGLMRGARLCRTANVIV